MVGLTYKRGGYCCHDITENRDESFYLISVFPLILTLFGVTNLVQTARKWGYLGIVEKMSYFIIEHLHLDVKNGWKWWEIPIKTTREGLVIDKIWVYLHVDQ